MDLEKRCLHRALPPADERRSDGRRPSGNPEHLGPLRDVSPELGAEEGADRTRGRAGRRREDSPSARNGFPVRDQPLLSARPLSEPEKALERLQAESAIHRVHIAGLGGERYVHDRDVRLLESFDSDAWQPRMSLLAPFDNLLGVREWTSRLFGFDYVHENFLPKDKRKFGTYVLPILWGDRFIGRIDPQMDRRHEKLLINSVHAEPGAPAGKEVSSKIGERIDDLAEFLGAKEVVYTARVPKAWKYSLR